MAVPLPTVLILASGQGARFRAAGGTTHKLQARLGERTVLEHTLAAVHESGLPWHLEDAGHPGMADSIAAAVRATAAAAGWLVLPGDLPLVQAATLRSLAAALRGHTVVVPVRGGPARPPGRFRGRLRPGPGGPERAARRRLGDPRPHAMAAGAG